ncbi:UNVERIFIED_CONTAM: hypothetical protein FKN15_029288 [Acipenser sinensis]
MATVTAGFHPCSSCRRKIPREDLHVQCMYCLGVKDASRALTDPDSCRICGVFQIRTLHQRLWLLTGVPASGVGTSAAASHGATTVWDTQFPSSTPSPPGRKRQLVEDTELSALAVLQNQMSEVLEFIASQKREQSPLSLPVLVGARIREFFYRESLEVMDGGSLEPTSSTFQGVIGRAAQFLKLPWQAAVELPELVLYHHARSQPVTGIQPFPPHLEFLREWAADLGLQDFPLVDSAFVDLVAALPLGGNPKDPVCPNKQCKVTEVHAKRAYVASAQATWLANLAYLLSAYLKSFLEFPVTEFTSSETQLVSSALVEINGFQGAALGHSLAALVVVRRQLWLSQARIPNAHKGYFLDAPISPGFTFGPVVEDVLRRSQQHREDSRRVTAVIPEPSSPQGVWGRPEVMLLSPGGTCATFSWRRWIPVADSPLQGSKVIAVGNRVPKRRRRRRAVNALPLSQAPDSLWPVAQHPFLQHHLSACRQCTTDNWAPYEPMASADMKFVSMKTAFLLAIMSAKRISELRALSVDPSCCCFRDEGHRVSLRTNPTFLPKVISEVTLNQTVELEAFHPPPFSTEEDQKLNLLCPIRALRNYIDRTKAVCKSDQLFVGHGPRSLGLGLSTHRLSHWVVDTMVAAYADEGLKSPAHLSAHSVKGMATSWALFRGAMLAEICDAASWATPLTFTRFHSLNVASLGRPTLGTRVLAEAQASSALMP